MKTLLAVSVAAALSGCASPQLRAREKASERLNACLDSVIHQHYLPSPDTEFLVKSCQDVYRMEVGK